VINRSSKTVRITSRNQLHAGTHRFRSERQTNGKPTESKRPVPGLETSVRLLERRRSVVAKGDSAIDTVPWKAHSFGTEVA
jgi:hypothetical protein